jgi:hypothetical protein
LLLHFFIIDVQNEIQLLQQWNNEKLIRTWLLLHQMVAYLLAFQTHSTKSTYLDVLIFQTHVIIKAQSFETSCKTKQ